MKRISLSVIFLFSLAALVQAQSINWISLSEAQSLAAQNNKKVMIFAEAKWCGYCKKMNQKVFPKQSVQNSLDKFFYPVRLDIESGDQVIFNGDTFTEKSLSRRFRVSSTPTVIFLDKQGGIIGVQPGYLPAEIFEKLLVYVGAEHTETISFKDYLNNHGVEIGQ